MPQLDQATFLSQLIAIVIALCFLFVVLNAIILPKVYQSLRLREIALAEATFQIENVCTLYGLTSFNYKNSLDISTLSLKGFVDDISFSINYDEFAFYFCKLNFWLDDEISDSFVEIMSDMNNRNNCAEFKNTFSLYFNFYFMNVCDIMYCHMLDLNEEFFNFDDVDARDIFEYSDLD